MTPAPFTAETWIVTNSLVLNVYPHEAAKGMGFSVCDDAEEP